MFDVIDDLKPVLLARTDSLERLLVVEESPNYAGELVFQPFSSEQSFYSQYKDWVSRYLVLSELFNLDTFVKQLQEDGWEVLFGSGCSQVLENYARWSQPLHIEGYTLHPFQQFCLNRAFEQRFFFWNWATGAGKSFCCAAGAKELFRRKEIDLVLSFTLSKSKINQQRFYQKAGLDVVVNDGTKSKRVAGYKEEHQVYVMNYEKAWVDNEALTALVAGKRVLYVLDEVHKVITDGKPNKARQALDRMQNAQSRMWPMSASVVNGNPLRFRDVYSLNGNARTNPLGSRADFERRYANEVKKTPVKTRSGQRFTLTTYDWSMSRLQEVRHRVGDRTMAVRKTDPGIKENFKGMATIVEPVQMSPQDRELTDIIIDQAKKAWNRDESLGPYYSLLRYVCNTSEALRVTQDDVGQQLVATYGELISSANSAKLEMLNDKLEEIRDAGDKVVVFTHWTNLGLHLITPHLKVPHVVHYGTGQTAKESQAAQDRFKSDPDITAFMTSDAGSHGLNLQCARYVLQYEPTYSFDDGMQRASRIDRSDSHLDGLTNYVYVTDDSVEERVWAVNNARRNLSAAVQGTAEVLSYGDDALSRRSEAENLTWLIFGGKA